MCKKIFKNMNTSQKYIGKKIIEIFLNPSWIGDKFMQFYLRIFWNKLGEIPEFSRLSRMFLNLLQIYQLVVKVYNKNKMSNEQKLQPTVIGIDLGAFSTKIAGVKKGVVEVLTNEANFRETPSVVGFGQGERKIGESGNVKIKSNHKNTIVSPTRFLNIPVEQLQNEQPYLSCKADFNEENKLNFPLIYNSKNEQFAPEQIVASYFSHLKEIVTGSGLVAKQFVVTVPSFFTSAQRRSIVQAAQIAGLNNVTVVNNLVAMGLDYGMMGRHDVKEGKNIMFIDVGHAKVEMGVIRFEGEGMNVLNEMGDVNLGCRNIDKNMFEAISKIFQEKTGLNLRENKKACIKLMENLEKKRKILSGIHETDLEIECLMEDEDLSLTLSREKMLEYSSDFFNQIQNLFMQFKQSNEEKGIEIDSIELVGGGSRIPAIIQLISNLFGISPSRTINSNETIARGAALYAVKKSGLFRSVNFQVKNKPNFPIRASWNFKNQDKICDEEDEYSGVQNQIIFDGSEALPDEKMFNLKGFSKKVEVLLSYDTLEEKMNKKIMLIEVESPQTEESELNFSFCLNESSILSLRHIEEKNNSKILYKIVQFGVLNDDEIRQYKSTERMMYVRDFETVKGYEKKNQLESFMYSQLEKLRQLPNYIEPQAIEHLIKQIEQFRNGLEEGSIKLSYKEYDQKKENFKKEIESLFKKNQEKKKQINRYFEELEKVHKFVQDHLDHISSNYRQNRRILSIYEQIKEILVEVKELIEVSKSKKPWELPLVSPQQLQQKYDKTRDLFNNVSRPSASEIYEPQHQSYNPQFYTQQQPRRKAQMPRQRQYHDPFDMGRSRFFSGGNDFFRGMGSFF